MLNRILDTGISVAYEAGNRPPIVDIVFVHGLQGHPFKTWNYRPKTPSRLPRRANEDRRNAIRRAASRLRRKSSKATPTDGTEPATRVPSGNDTRSKSVFWPADLLPERCPNSRILMFGYDSKITKYTAGGTNQNSILSHSKDLLFALCRERDSNRPLIFIAHSLGGIIVKEMLARSSSSPDAEVRNIVESTAAVVFLGTPHRGSQDVAALGEVVRSVVNSFGMETTPGILDALGLKTSDLERAQEAFSALWQKHDFQVKTFQEGLRLARLGEKVVPDYSSLIGDHREHAETLQANHIEMCRYSGPDDPNYRKVAGEIHWIYQSIAKVQAINAPTDQAIRQRPTLGSSVTSLKGPPHIANYSQVNEACLESLWFPAIKARYQSLERPADQTCSWLFTHPLYQNWFNSGREAKSRGLLWLKGIPGAGKSTLMKEAFCRAALGQVESNYRTACFFFNAKGDALEKSRLGLFRSLLFQLLPGDKQGLQSFRKLWDEKYNFVRQGKGIETPAWTESELETFLESLLINQTGKTIIFIDALNECAVKQRKVAHFWRMITRKTYERGVDLNVCLSSTHFPTIALSDCPEIIVEEHNSGDIATYVDHKLQLSIATQGPQWELLRENILGKAAGVFLWVVLVVEDVLRSWDDGNGVSFLIKQVTDVPEELEILFSDMFSNLEPQAKELTSRFFQWAILATKPLRVHEWHHIMAFIRQPAPKSLSEWRQSDTFTESDEQLEKQIRSISKGLVEVRKLGAGDSQQEGIDVASIHAGAGSLNLEHGETRIVQVIHETVRDFFLKGDGFSLLEPPPISQTFGLSLFKVERSAAQSQHIGGGHLSIMATCLDYLNISELDALVEARAEVAKHNFNQRRLRSFPGSVSPDKSYAGYRDEVPDIKNRPSHDKQSATIAGKASISEMLVLLDDAPGVDVIEWMAKDDIVCAGWRYPDEFPCKSVSHSSNVSRPRLLEDYPALLSYAIFEIFTHAKLAKKYQADPSPIFKRLKDGGEWARWLALREDIPDNTIMRSYLHRLGLWLWITSTHNASTYEYSQLEERDDDYRLHRTPSVASFGSAGSHNAPYSPENSPPASPLVRPRPLGHQMPSGEYFPDIPLNTGI